MKRWPGFEQLTLCMFTQTEESKTEFCPLSLHVRSRRSGHQMHQTTLSLPKTPHIYKHRIFNLLVSSDWFWLHCLCPQVSALILYVLTESESISASFSLYHNFQWLHKGIEVLEHIYYLSRSQNVSGLWR